MKCTQSLSFWYVKVFWSPKSPTAQTAPVLPPMPIVLCADPRDLFRAPAGQRGPHPGDCVYLVPAHDHVLLPWEPLLLGDLLHSLLSPPYSQVS